MLAAYAKDHSIGSGGELRIAEWCFEFLGFCKKHTGEWKQDASLLVAHHSGLYAVEDWMPIGVTDYCAIGSGFEHAEAAMYLGKTPAEAADVAINMSFGCGGKIVERTVDLRRAVS
jgi:ATP-dependent protease HslVU (ClpYQ) peptidase subunit